MPRERSGPDGGTGDGPSSCAVCGTTVACRPAGWSLQVDDGSATYLCGACTRRHLRSIEARLDDGWW